jgi:hypothetical protein
MRTAALIPLALAVALLALVANVAAKAPPVQPSPPAAYRIIVHPNNPVTSVSQGFLQDAFLKKRTRWAGNVVIQPVDLKPASPVRIKFSQEVLGRPVAAVRSYWQQRIFSGRDVPPPELEGDEAVVSHVLKHEGAVGYVSGTADLAGAKPIVVGK